ncbi:MAG: DNA adenine methylase [Nanoarchaeota archaeon]
MISYIGGKKFHTKYIIKEFPDYFESYCEPFSGAFWVFIQSSIKKRKVIYNDANPNMVNLFYCSSRDPVKMVNELKKYKPQDPSLFIKFRDEIFGRGFNSKIKMPDFDLAVKFAYIQTQIFAGNTLRENTKITLLNKKYRSKYEQLIDKFSKEKIVNKLLSITDFENLDFEKCIEKYDHKNAMFYIDPPYFDLEKYYTVGSSDIHERLSKCVNNVKGKVIISYYDFDLIKRWYSSDKFNFVKYNINCQNGNRLKKNSSKRQELLIKNFA